MQIVNIVIQCRREIDDTRYNSGRLVANFYQQTLGTGKQVLALQVIQGTACSAEHLTTANGPRLRRERVDRVALLAEIGRRLRLVVRIRTVEPTIHATEFVVHVTDAEIAPLAVVVVLTDANVELTHGRRHFLDD